jgi:hypothetical protein
MTVAAGAAVGRPGEGSEGVSALRSFDPRRNRPAESSTPPKAPNPPKEAAAAQPGLGALGSLGVACPGSGPADYAYAADALCRAENALLPVSDKAELMIRGERL